jgi:hypothetical protein
MHYEFVESPSDPTKLDVMMYPEEIPVLQALVDAVPTNGVILEYGSGGSTQFFADNLGEGRRLISIEHNEEWYDKVTVALKGHPHTDRIERFLHKPDFPLSRYVFANPEEEMPAGLQDYIHTNLALPYTYSAVDFVLVDGVARGACLAALRTRLAPGTIVALHDYTGRENWYDWAVRLFDVVSGPIGRAGLLTLRVPF